MKIFFIIASLMVSLVVLGEARVVGELNGFGVLVEVHETNYFAVPTHILATASEPRVEYAGVTYEIEEYLVSDSLDLALLRVKNLPKNVSAYKLTFVDKPKQSLFSFEIKKSNLRELSNLKIEELKGYSGKFVKYGKKEGIFLGCLVDKDGVIKYYVAVNLAALSNDFKSKKFELIGKDFAKKFEK